MKIKNLWIWALAMVLATSCSDEEEATFVQVPLSMSAVINNSAATRSVSSVTEVTAFASEAEIGVSGTYKDVDDTTSKYIYNKKYTLGDAGTWTSEAPFYYQNANQVAFSAYYPYAENADADGILSGVEAKDYLYATQTASAHDANAGKVAFTFRHVMSKIKVNFLPGDGLTTDSIRKIQTFHIKGLYTKGTFNTMNGSVEGTSEVDYIKGTVTTSEVTTTEGSTTETIGSAIVFPQVGNQFTFIVKIGSINYQSQSLELTEALASNMVYSYTITVNKTGLSVASNESDAIQGWDTINVSVDEDGSVTTDNTDNTGSGDSSDDNSSDDDYNYDVEDGDLEDDGTGATVSDTAQLYSLLLSNGKFVNLWDSTTGGLTADYATIISGLSASQKPVGIVYYLYQEGDDSTANGEDYTNGLIVSTKHLDDGAYLKWQTKTATGKTTVTGFGGYSNTAALREYNNDSSTDEKNLVLVVSTLDSEKRAQITGASAWFIPSVTELQKLAAVYSNINKILTALGKTELSTNADYGYWSSSQVDDNSAYRVKMDNGKDESKAKTTYRYAIPICAF